MALPSMVIQKSRTTVNTVNSSIVNNILYAIWYDMLNIANNGAAKYGNIQRQRQRDEEGRTGGTKMKGAAARQLREQRLNNEVSGGVTKKAAAAK
jgi:hypothetical protein